jgi:hypothetical protein
MPVPRIRVQPQAPRFAESVSRSGVDTATLATPLPILATLDRQDVQWET